MLSDAGTAALAEDGADLTLTAAVTTLHMRQFQAAHKGAGAWLVLPVPSPALEDASLWPPVPQDLFASDGFNPAEVMLSVTADSAPVAVLTDFAQYHRAPRLYRGTSGAFSPARRSRPALGWVAGARDP